MTAPEMVVDAIRRARDDTRPTGERIIAAGAAVVTIPEAVFWTIVIALSGALAGIVRLVYRNQQRLEELERAKVDKAEHVTDAAKCRANLTACIHRLEVELVAQGGTLDAIAREHGIKPHPRPSNGGGKRE